MHGHTLDGDGQIDQSMTKVHRTAADKVALGNVSLKKRSGVWEHACVRSHKNATKLEYRDGSIAPQQTALSR